MITGALKRDIDALWTEFWQGGITNPLTVIEQVTFLMFARLLDINETRDENRLKRAGKRDTPPRFKEDEQHLRWSHFRHLGAEEMLPLVRDEVFPHFRKSSASGAAFAEFMKDAQLMIQKESLLVKAVNMIDKLPLTEGDTKGDLYEYLLSKLTTAGINGQFRTPRHIIQLMVEILDPKPDEVVGDPSAGTGGFLVETMQYLMKTYTSEEGIIEEIDPETGKIEKIYTGDLLEDHREHIRNKMFHGFDFDATMLRIAAMNLMLHGVDNPKIHYQDTLSARFSEKYPRAAAESFDLILANPPFTGSLDFEDVHPGLLRKVKTKKTELLFLVLILRMLKTGGRSATIVPDGVLFGSSKAHVDLRRQLVEDNQLEAMISLPSGVFKPYAGVSTAILVFTKGGRTDNVFFYAIKNDGFTLDDKREPIPENDLPGCIEAWKNRDVQTDQNRKDKGFFVNVDEIRDANFDLTFGRYREVEFIPEDTEHPLEILGKMKSLNQQIDQDIAELEAMLK